MTPADGPPQHAAHPGAEDLGLDIGAPQVGPVGRALGIGVVGAGFIVTDCHLPCYKAAGFRVAAVCSADPRNARRLADRYDIATVHDTPAELAGDPAVEIADIAVPPHRQAGVIADLLRHRRHLRGILAQKPLGTDLAEARRIVADCRAAGVTLAVNQNMRFDHGVRALKCLLDRGELGEPVLATLDMRAIPHWMPWQAELGWLTLRIMSIHHLDAFRFLFGDPERIFCSVRTDPRTKFPHADGICAYILEYPGGLRAMSVDDVWAGPAREGAAADLGIRWRVGGTQGLALGTVGWPDYPRGSPSTIDWTTTRHPGRWFRPRWTQQWFPHAFEGPMAQLLNAVERGAEPEIGGADNLLTMALVEAAYRSAAEHRAVALAEMV